MPSAPLIGTPPTLSWDAQARPTADRFGDSYYSDDPMAEVRHVFLQGTQLPQRWNKPGGPHIVGETGFGTGLNFLMLWDLWRRSAAAPRHISFASVEAWPMTRQQLAQAHQAFPELAELSSTLLAQWPEQGLPQGRHKFSFESGKVTLHLVVDDALAGIQSLCVPGGVQVWFLDGFAPAQNPAMWSPALFTALAKQSAPQAHLATFTAVGDVRRQLGYAGFQVERVPGFGRKRHMTRAIYQAAPWPHWAQPPAGEHNGAQSIAIVGAGIAGLSVAQVLDARGHAVHVFEKAKALGQGASGLPSAMLMPRPDLGKGVRARLSQNGFAFAHQYWAGINGAFAQTGVIQHPKSANEAARFAAYADQTELATWDGTVLHHTQGGTINVPVALETLRRKVEASGGQVHLGHAFTPDLADRYDAIIWATGAFDQAVSRALVPYRMMAGEMVTISRATTIPEVARSHIAPLGPDHSVIGATFYPCEGAEHAPAPDKTALDELAGQWGAQPHSIWQGVRATLPDQVPVVGPLMQQADFTAHFAPLKDGPFASPKGDIPYLSKHWLFNGFGARGFQLAPYLAPHLADLIEARVCSLSLADMAALHPARFAVRQIIKGG